MEYIVEARLGTDMAGAMIEMRAWLDHNRIEARAFGYSAGCPGIAFRLSFTIEAEALAFAQAFAGTIKHYEASPEGRMTNWRERWPVKGAAAGSDEAAHPAALPP